MNRNQAVKVVLTAVAFMFVTGCGGGSKEGGGSPLPAGTEDIPVDFFGELSVDVTNDFFAGSWKTKGYSIREADEKIDVESLLTAGADGSISTPSVKPLFDYSAGDFGIPDYYGNGACERVVIQDGVIGQQEIGNLLNASLTYEVIDTGFNPIVRFTLKGESAPACCVRPRSEFDYLVDPSEDSSALAALVDEGAYNSQCEGFDTTLQPYETMVGYLVVGARKNELALMDDDSDFVVILTRSE